MEVFRTPIPLIADPMLDPSQGFVSLGSCFADSIGQRLLANKWSGLSNPFGTLFHPLAIFESLQAHRGLDEGLFLESSGLSYHYRLPKTFFAQDRAALKAKFHETKEALHRELEKPGSILLLTLGTSLLYSLKQEWVANCHQQPSKLFEKSMSSVTSMMQAWEQALAELPKHCRVIVTVSPVRHLKEGLAQSSLSKSQLRVLAECMRASAPDRVRYFPAYEIMMDELRDYRFYARDMLHPSEQAIDYIWQRFQDAYFTPAATERVTNWQKLQARLDHRPLHPQSEDYRKFLRQLLRDLEDFPDLSLDAERGFISAKLAEGESD